MVVRVLDQDAAFLRLIEKDGLVPGSRVTVKSRLEAADRVEIEVDGGTVALGFRAASKIFVRPSDA